MPRLRSRSRAHPLFRPAASAPALALALSAAACGGPRPVEMVAAEPLAYAVPEPDSLAYRFADTAEFVIETGALGATRVRTTQEGRAMLAFADAGEALRVVVSFPRLAATFGTSAQGEERADESQLGGPLVVRLTPAGRLTVVDTPAIAPALADMVGPESLVRPLFVHLPNRPVEPGARWVDTVETREAAGGTSTVGRSIITTTLVGDTLLDERWVLLLRTRSENSVEVSGESGGVQVEQTMEGITEGEVLWDPRAAELLARHEEGSLSGTLRMPDTAVQPLPVTGTVRRVVRREP